VFDDQNGQISAPDPELITLDKELEDLSSTTLHIKDPYDYQRRLFIHTYKRHTKAAQKIQYFPPATQLSLV
jgi:hypothetical protein